jgi:hypothetical protein
MTLPVRYFAAPPTRIVGSSAWWAFKGAQLGATAGATVGIYATALQGLASAVAYALPLLATVSMLVAAGAAAGGAVGAVAPSVLERLRGRVPLGLIVAAQPVVGAVAGSIAACLFAGMRAAFGGPHPPLAAVALMFLGALFGAPTAAVWWLPFTVATVLGRRWPVTTAAGVVAPLLVLAAIAAVGL